MNPENADNTAELTMVPLPPTRILISICTFRRIKLQFCKVTAKYIQSYKCQHGSSNGRQMQK